VLNVLPTNVPLSQQLVLYLGPLAMMNKFKSSALSKSVAKARRYCWFMFFHAVLFYLIFGPIP
jgi:hypothetical protein